MAWIQCYPYQELGWAVLISRIDRVNSAESSVLSIQIYETSDILLDHVYFIKNIRCWITYQLMHCSIERLSELD
jgi:hypothetical protein